MINGFEIKVARYNFSCPICGTIVRCGESYAEDLDGDAFCVCVLPSRKLVPVETVVPKEDIDKDNISHLLNYEL